MELSFWGEGRTGPWLLNSPDSTRSRYAPDRRGPARREGVPKAYGQADDTWCAQSSTFRHLGDASPRGHGPSDRLPQCGDDVGLARLAGGPPDDPALGVEDQHGRRLEDVEFAYEVQVVLRVDLDVGHALDQAGHLAEDRKSTRLN